MCNMCNGRGMYTYYPPEDYKKVVETEEYRAADKATKRSLLDPYRKVGICPTVMRKYQKTQEQLKNAQIKTEGQIIREENSTITNNTP